MFHDSIDLLDYAKNCNYDCEELEGMSYVEAACIYFGLDILLSVVPTPDNMDSVARLDWMDKLKDLPGIYLGNSPSGKFHAITWNPILKEYWCPKDGIMARHNLMTVDAFVIVSQITK